MRIKEGLLKLLDMAKKTNKRIISIVLTAIMFFSGLPLTEVAAARSLEVRNNWIVADSGNDTITIAHRNPSIPTTELYVSDATFNIERDFDQVAKVLVSNLSEQNMEVYLAVENRYTDIHVDFVRAGSIDEPLVIRANESEQIELSIFAQNASRESYDISVIAYIVENGQER